MSGIDIQAANNESLLELHMFLSIFHYIDIQTNGGLICIENRPAYCERGRYLVKVFPEDHQILYIDESDMFPRYYFIFDNLISELACWFKARKLTVISINKHGEHPHESIN